MSLVQIAVVAAAAFSPGPACRRGALRAARVVAAAPSFEESLESAPAMCRSLQAGESPAGLAELVSSSAGARGFFVNYLTDPEWSVADAAEPPASLASALVDAPAEVKEVMLMNVAMSSASRVAHDAAGDAESASASELTCERAVLLVAALAPRAPALADALAALRGATTAAISPPETLGADEEAQLAAYVAIEAGGEEQAVWEAFLERWYYDAEQLEGVSAALARCGAPAIVD